MRLDRIAATHKNGLAAGMSVVVAANLSVSRHAALRLADTSRMAGAQTDHGARRSATRVVVADDDVLLREGLASLLERSGFEVVGQAGDGRSSSRSSASTTPDLVARRHPHAADPHDGGARRGAAIREEFPEIGILVLSAYVEVEHAMELLASGQRSGYLLKSRVTDVDEFIETLERIAREARSSIPRSSRSSSRRAGSTTRSRS